MLLDFARFERLFPKTLLSFWKGQVIAVLVVAAAAGIRLVLDDILSGVPFITFFPAVIVAAVWGGYRAAGTVLVLGSAIASHFWLFQDNEGIDTSSSIAALILFCVIGVLLISLVHLMHRLIQTSTAAEARAELVAGEMRHRVANLLQVVQSITRRSAKGAKDVTQLEEILLARFHALGQAQKLVSAVPDERTDLRRLVDDLLGAFDRSRIAISGPPSGVPGDLSVMLGLVIFELATNSAKHGSLSEPLGRVAIRWAEVAGRISIDWQESDGPPVAVPERRGFGASLLGSAIPADRGRITVEYRQSGLRCTIEIRLAAG